MASFQQGEKQLFEKFWMGTFKAVATPRRESVIVASITARKPLSSDNVNCSLSPNKDTRQEKLKENMENGSTTRRLGRELSPHQYHGDRFLEAEPLSPSPPPKGKKKKKKSDRKKRKRSRSYSPSPVKKKKKKSSKKQKRNRSSSKKRRHTSSSPKSKRKHDRKHRKQSRGRPRKSHHHRYQHSRSPSTESRTYENRTREQSKEERHRSRRKKHKYHNSRSVNKKQREVTPLSAQSSICSSKLTISQSVPGLLVTTENHGGCQKDVSNEYDSGNDLCTPPSMQTSSSVLKINQDKESPIHQGFGRVPSSVKTPNGHSDNISDSGNSSASCFSFSKDSSLHLEDSRTPAKRDLSSCLGCLEEHKSVSDISPDRTSVHRDRSRSSSYRSTRRSYSRSSSHSISSYSSYYRSSSGRTSRSRSISSGARSYSRSPSYSSKSARKSTGSRNSRTRRSPSYSRYSPSRDRERNNKYDSGEKETRKGGHRIRRSSYSPLRKRRRNSPSHLEARRITSARKRPIPYYRPSPSSSSSDSSNPSWYNPRSRSRSHSYSSHSRSRSRDWNRSSREPSRSRSRSWSRSSDSCDSLRR
ncbi:serine/arginine repetitive matrix protein 4 [Bufo gargarizans]|uniref:serine/arginine repetitive matrix protein 4 n=1 Tax=Bufo gargarizans TaxID=30331 RepID=UPI001CF5CCFD|nr:serine/arginine repetitive matrix protein 4 [Bufo gargarizans]